MRLLQSIKRLFIGESKDPLDPEVFHQLSLAAFLAWVGLGADGLSSSCYGPEETFRALGEHRHLAVFLAIATAVTVLVISASYSQIIEQFPSGGGGYLVASKLLGRGAGLVSGAALVVDYALTIAISVAVGVQALCSLKPGGVPQPEQLVLSLAVVGLLIVLNLRGIKESVQLLLPIFILFLITHAAMIGYGVIRHAAQVPQLLSETSADLSGTWKSLGGLGTLALLLRAFSLGGGTYTGIEAVSNGLTMLREPRVRTGRRTMAFMAVSLSFTAGGLLLAYLLNGVSKTGTETLNATLAKTLTTGLLGSGPATQTVVWVTLVTEGALLFVAAQAGILAGPRVLASMALDSWVPHRFALLSERLVTQNGILVMGLGGAGFLLYTRGLPDLIVVMYSINVFLTFSLTQLGMCVHWWRIRGQAAWLRGFLVNGVGLMLTACILVVTVTLKFREGGWFTVLVTGSFVLLCLAMKRHYDSVKGLMRQADEILAAVPKLRGDASGQMPKVEPVTRTTPTAVFMVAGFNGLGIHAVLQVQQYFPRHFKNCVFLSVGVVDSASFKGSDEVENLKRETERDLQKYVEFARGLGMQAEHRYAIGADLLDELIDLCASVGESYARPVFFASKLIFPRENFVNRLLHNQTPFAMQRRLQFQGLQAVILPIRVRV